MRDRRIDIFNLLKNEGKLTKVKLFVSSSEETDPYEHTKETTKQQYISIDALVRDVSVEALAWKYYGNIPIGSKQLIVENKYINTIKASAQIQIGDDNYFCWKDDAQNFGIIRRTDYAIVIVGLKPINA